MGGIRKLVLSTAVYDLNVIGYYYPYEIVFVYSPALSTVDMCSNSDKTMTADAVAVAMEAHRTDFCSSTPPMRPKGRLRRRTSGFLLRPASRGSCCSSHSTSKQSQSLTISAYANATPDGWGRGRLGPRPLSQTTTRDLQIYSVARTR